MGVTRWGGGGAPTQHCAWSQEPHARDSFLSEEEAAATPIPSRKPPAAPGWGLQQPAAAS